MDKQAALLVIFLAFFFAPFLLATLAALLSTYLRQRPPMASLEAVDRATIAAYAQRAAMARYYLGGGLLAGAVAWEALDLRLTGFGLATLLPMYGFLVHLRCPTCASHNLDFWRRGDAMCRYCGARLKR